ncbi:MAG: glycerophosphodiester phosphodiesterase [Acidimicrobiia bacterium]
MTNDSVSPHPKVVGHRGWPALFPDNTLAGFVAAAQVAAAVELDVRRSRDGKLVLSHDPELAGLVVAEHPWEELAELDLGGGHRPALLDEVLAALPETALQMEIKNLPGQLGFEPDHRLALEAASRARPGDIVTSFNPETLLAVRRDFPAVDTGLAVEAWADLGASLDACVEVGHRALVPAQSLLVGSLDPDRLRGVEVYPWTVNDPERGRELVAWGASGIITDDPGLMAQTLGRET